MRRANASFQNFGGSGSETINHVFTATGIEIESKVPAAGVSEFIVVRNDLSDTSDQVIIGTSSIDAGFITFADVDGNVGISLGSDEKGGRIVLSDNTGVTGVVIGPTGVDSPLINDTIVSSNSTLGNTITNREITVNFSSAGTITLAANADEWQAGTFLIFQDISGNASANPVSIDPNNGATGLTLDGGTVAKELITSDYGTAKVVLVRSNTSSNSTEWYSETQQSQRGVDAGEVNTNTVLSFPQTSVSVNTSAAALVQITLPDASNYVGETVLIKKVTTDSNTLSIVPPSGQFLEGVNTAVNATASKQGYTIVSNGNTGWWIVGAYNI